MIILYALAPIVFYRTPELALLVPGLLALFHRKHTCRYTILCIATLYAILRLWTPYAPMLSALASTYLLICFFRQKSNVAWRALLALILLEGGLLSMGGRLTFSLFQGALSYFFATLIFIASEEVFLQGYIRQRFGGGLMRSLLFGIMWALWHLPFYLNTRYFIIQLFHGTALRLFIESRFEKGGMVTAICLHATHNMLPFFFENHWPISIHLLFATLLAAMAIFSSNRSNTSP